MPTQYEDVEGGSSCECGNPSCEDSMPHWRTITAQQYMDGGDAGGDYDEAFIVHPETGARREIWDVGCTHDEFGNVVIYTAAADPIRVTPNTPIEVR